MPKASMIDIHGQTFGHWTVLGHSGRTKAGQAMWLCRCKCGKTRPVIGVHLRCGHSKSCGCKGVEKRVKEKRTNPLLRDIPLPCGCVRSGYGLHQYCEKGEALYQRWEQTRKQLLRLGVRAKGSFTEMALESFQALLQNHLMGQREMSK